MIGSIKKQGYRPVMIAFMLAHAANDGFNALFPPLLPLIREYYGLSYSELGGFLTLFRFFGGILQIPVGYLSYYIPSSTIMVSGLLWLSIGLLLATFARNYWPLAASFSIAGIGAATYHPLSFSILSRLFRTEIMGRIVGIHMGASSAAHLAGPFIVFLTASRLGWQWPLRLWSLFGIFAALFLLAVLRRSAGREERTSGKILKLPFASASMIFYVIFRFVWGASWKGMTEFLPLFLVETARFSVNFATLYFMAMYFVEIFARPIVGDLSDKIGKRKLFILIECIFCIIFFLCITLFKAKSMLLFIILGIGLLAGTIPVVANAYAIAMVPYEQRDRTMGYLFTVNNVATTASPLLTGFIADNFGLNQSFVILSGILTLSLIFLFFSKEEG